MPASLAIVPQIYAAALRPGQWPAVMARVADWLGASAGSLFTSHSATDPQALLLGHNLSPQTIEDYATSWHREDIWALAAARRGHMAAGSVVLGAELLPRDELLRSRYYNEFTRDAGMEALLGSVLFDGSDPDAPPFTNLCWYRAPGQPQFEREDKRRLRDLVPHFQQALQLQYRLQALHRQALAHGPAAAQAPCASLLLDAQGRIVDGNPAGRALLAQPGVLRMAGDRLEGVGLRCAPSITQALRHCRVAPVQLLVQWPDDTRTTVVKATLAGVPAEQQTWLGRHDRPHAVLLIELPRDDTAQITLRAAELFGYTRAEQRVTLRLLQGLSLEEIARAHGVSLNTVRSQTRSLLAKTGLSRQIDLVRLLGRL